MVFGSNPFGSLAGAFLPNGSGASGGLGAKGKALIAAQKAAQNPAPSDAMAMPKGDGTYAATSGTAGAGAATTAPTGGWFDQQRPNIPTSAAPAPVPGGGAIASDPGMATTGQGINERNPVNAAGPMIPPTGAAPSAGASPSGTPSALSGYTGAPININVPFNPQSFVGSDAYNFTKDEGLDALSRYHFANGTAGTGGFSRDVMKFASGNAANFWDKQLQHDTDIATGNANRTLTGLSSLADRGLTAAGGQAGYGLEAGNAAAGGTIGQANALNTGVSSAANSLSEYFARRRANQPTVDYGPGGVLN